MFLPTDDVIQKVKMRKIPHGFEEQPIPVMFVAKFCENKDIQ